LWRATRAENGLVVQGCVAQVSIKDELNPDLDLGKGLKDRCKQSLHGRVKTVLAAPYSDGNSGCGIPGTFTSSCLRAFNDKIDDSCLMAAWMGR